MENSSKDDVLEISQKDYQKITNSLEKEGFREGKSKANEKDFQKSFDNGYEDGFKIGFVLGKSKKDNAKNGRCELCKNQSLLQKSEIVVREIFRKNYETYIEN